MVNTDLTFNLSSLEALTPETVTYMAGSTSVTDTYTGALLWDVFTQAGIETDPNIKNDILRMVMTVTGSDGYQVAFSGGELSPKFGNEPILVAYSDADGQLATAGSNGFARLVVPGDMAGGRYVSNISEMSVFDGVAGAVPESSTWAMMLLGFLGVGLMAYRQKQSGRELDRYHHHRETAFGRSFCLADYFSKRTRAIAVRSELFNGAARHGPAATTSPWRRLGAVSCAGERARSLQEDS